MKKVNLFSAVCISWLVSGCYSHQAPVTGTAVQHNFAIQIINPEPHPNAQAGPASGSRIAGAIQRYQDGTVIEPKTLKLNKSRGKSD